MDVSDAKNESQGATDNDGAEKGNEKDSDVRTCAGWLEADGTDREASEGTGSRKR